MPGRRWGDETRVTRPRTASGERKRERGGSRFKRSASSIADAGETGWRHPAHRAPPWDSVPAADWRDRPPASSGRRVARQDRPASRVWARAARYGARGWRVMDSLMWRVAGYGFTNGNANGNTPSSGYGGWARGHDSLPWPEEGGQEQQEEGRCCCRIGAALESHCRVLQGIAAYCCLLQNIAYIA